MRTAVLPFVQGTTEIIKRVLERHNIYIYIYIYIFSIISVVNNGFQAF